MGAARAEPKTFLFPEFQQESDDADRVKRDERILVILGNPPYNSFAGMAEQEEERRLTTAYRTPLDPLLTRPQGQGLNDLYVRFFRIAEHRIVDQTNEGLVCFVSNYSWLDGLSHTVMRERFLREFDEITIDCLNGDKYRTGKLTPEGKPDPSVFSTETNKEGIQVGTAIALLLRTASHSGPAEVYYRDLWGATKRAELALESQGGVIPQYQKVIPKRELGLMFRPSTTSADYTSWPLLTDLFPVSFPGIKTSRDSVVVDIDRDRLEARMKMYFDPKVSFEELKELMPDVTRDTGRFNAIESRRTLLRRGYRPENLVKYFYRPLDVRYLYWEDQTKLLDEKRTESRLHHVPGNVCLEARQKQPMDKFDRGYVTRYPGDNLGNGLSNYFPLYLSEAASLPGSTEININVSDAAADTAPSKESIFFHAVAILNTPAYRSENNDALRQDWPRVPIPNSAELLSASAALGRELADLLDPNAPVPGVTTGQIRRALHSIAIISCAEDRQLDPSRDLSLTAGWGHAGKGGAIMPAKGRTLGREYSLNELETFTSVPEPLTLLGSRAIDVYLNDAAYWRNIPEAVWEYTIGGYQVLKKWLSYREQEILSRPLHVEETRLFTQIARRIASILLLSPQLDSNYESVRANPTSF
jgi:predicted helicase